MATNPTPELAVLISSVEEKGDSITTPHLKITAAVVQVVDGKVRNLSTSGWDRHPAAQLETSTYVWRDSGCSWDVEYRDVYTVRLDDLEAMVKYLRKVTKALDRMQHDRGYAESFAEQVTRFAEAVGAKTFIWKTDPSLRVTMHDEANYRHTTADIARNHVTSLVEAFRKEDTQS